MLEHKVSEIKKTIIDIAAGTVGCHLGGCLSVVEILASVYEKYWHDPQTKIVLSKGHAAAALYATLYQYGVLTENPALTYGQKKSIFTGHPNHKIAGISFSTGSLGHGIPYAIGWALACKIKNNSGLGIAIVGDGELQEGLCWESFQFAHAKNINNFICIVDLNNCQNDGYVKMISSMDNLQERFEAFGFEVITVDGHNINEILSALNFCNKPLAILAKTQKGNSVNNISGNPKSHYMKIEKKQAKLWKRRIT